MERLKKWAPSNSELQNFEVEPLIPAFTTLEERKRWKVSFASLEARGKYQNVGKMIEIDASD